MHAASTCSASGARGAAAALPIKAASKRSGMLARFAILRLQLVLEGEPGPQRRVRRTPTLLQAWTAVLLQQRPQRSARRSRDLVLAQLCTISRLCSRTSWHAIVMLKSCQKSAWGTSARVSSRVQAYQAKKLMFAH